MEILQNPIAICIIVAILTIILIKININITNEKINNVNFTKIVILVIIMTLLSIILYNFSNNTKVSLDQEIFTGAPNF
jgi:hypothetical protein